jgi:hypothetical protein
MFGMRGEDMIRKLLIVTSALLALVSLVLCVSSYLRPISYHLMLPNHALGVVHFSDGFIVAGHVFSTERVTGTKSAVKVELFPKEDDAGLIIVKLQYCSEHGPVMLGIMLPCFTPTSANCRSLTHTMIMRFTRAPIWLLPLPFAIYPTIVFIRGPYRRYRRRKKGLCLNCGYNLTGNVSGICPECGEKI